MAMSSTTLPVGEYEVRFSYISAAGQAIHSSAYAFRIQEKERLSNGTFVQSFIEQHEGKWESVYQYVGNKAYPEHHGREEWEEHDQKWHTPTSPIPIPVLNENFFFLPHFVEKESPSMETLWRGDRKKDVKEDFLYEPPSEMGYMRTWEIEAFSVSAPIWAGYWCYEIDEGKHDPYFYLYVESRYDTFTIDCFCSANENQETTNTNDHFPPTSNIEINIGF